MANKSNVENRETPQFFTNTNNIKMLMNFEKLRIALNSIVKKRVQTKF